MTTRSFLTGDQNISFTYRHINANECEQNLNINSEVIYEGGSWLISLILLSPTVLKGE